MTYPIISGGIIQDTNVNEATISISETRTLQDKLSDVISVKDFGAIGDGVTDDTTSIQNAINFAQTNHCDLIFPNGKFLITSTLVISDCLTISGIFPNPTHSNSTPVDNVPSRGTWLYFNHSNKGIQIYNSSMGWLGVRINNIGTCRPQNTTFGSSWSPNDFDYDFSIEKADDTLLDHIFMLNPTKGIYTSSRSSLSYIFGNPMTQGIYADNVTDVLRIDQVHFWSYWTTSSTTGPWTTNNLDAITLGRVDNPILTNIFVFAGRSLLRCTKTINGKASKVKLSNSDADLTSHLLYIDNTTNSANINVEMTNVSHQGHNTIQTNGQCLLIQGSGNRVSISNIRSDYNGAEFAKVEGANCLIQINHLQSVVWAQESSAYMFNIANGSILDLNGSLVYANTSNSLGTFAPTGNINSDVWQTPDLTVSAANGSFNTVSSSFKFLRKGKQITLAGQLILTDIGTASGTIHITLPINSASFGIPFVGTAKDFTNGTKPLICYVTSGTNIMAINGADGTTPWINGYSIGFTLTYAIP